MKENPPFVTDGLYKIGDKITKKPEETQTDSAEPVQTSVKELPKEKLLEFDRLKHDLECRLAGLTAAYQTEKEVLKERLGELQRAEEKLKNVLETLESTLLPQNADPEARAKLRLLFRSLEQMRLETIRISSAMDGTRPAADITSTAKPAVSQAPETPGELMKKGFFFFLPAGILIFLCTLLLGTAFVLAWKVAF